jgi:hypothetical protein
MPLGKKDTEIKRKFAKEYPGRGERVYYASVNAGKVRNTPEARRFAKKRAHARQKRKDGRR